MKTRHIIAIGLLSALAVGLLGFAISKTNKKPKTLETSATTYPAIDTINQENEITKYSITVAEQMPQIDDTTILYLPIFNGQITYEIVNNTTQINFFSIEFGSLAYVTNNGIQHLRIEETNWDVARATINTTLIIKQTNLSYSNIITRDTHTLQLDTQWFFYDTANTEFYYTTRLFFYTVDALPTTITQTTTTYYDIFWFPINIYNTGFNTGRDEGTEIGYEEGYTAGHTTGYNEGVAFGYDASALENPVDFAPMMLNILTMPFTFISQAFDVTLWPGTQYQINIGNFIKALLAISAILFIIKLFTSGFSIIGNYSANVRNQQNLKSNLKQKKTASKINKQNSKKE